jgi:hypothetical protein
MASNIDGYVAAIEDRIDLVAAISRTKRGGTAHILLTNAR